MEESFKKNLFQKKLNDIVSLLQKKNEITTQDIQNILKQLYVLETISKYLDKKGNCQKSLNKIHLKVINAKDIIWNNLNILSPLLHQKNFFTELKLENAKIKADELLFNHLIYSLILKSIASAPLQSKIEIYSYKIRNYFVFEMLNKNYTNVVKNNVKINKKNYPQIDFTTIDEPMCKEIIEIHKGEIKYNYYDKNKGKVLFSLVLPC